ncbi:hypothetical protein B7463_g3510, partial [Scytalidium lignicola]
MLAEMMAMAGYTRHSSKIHEGFFCTSVAPSLGFHPRGTGAPQLWRSFMTDDHTPVELSWCWSSSKINPSVRYSVEPIGKCAGQTVDPINTAANIRLLGEALPLAPEMDLYLHRHFQHLLLSRNLPDKKELTTDIPQSQIFIAFDLLETDIVVKQYYLPSWRALAEGNSNFTIIKDAIRKLLGPADALLTSFDVLVDFIETLPIQLQPAVEIMAIDCLDPLRSRLKIYVRSRETTLQSVIEMLTLGGRAPKTFEEQDSLRELWYSVFGLSSDEHMDNHPLPEKDHRTGGILYYFELKCGATIPKTKVYLPVRHYAQNDDQIARGLSEYLERRGKKLTTGSYYNSVQKLWCVLPLSVKLPVSYQLYNSPQWKSVDGQCLDKFLRGRESSENWRKYGAVYRIWSGFIPEIVLTKPEDVKTFYTDSSVHSKSPSSNGGWLFHQLLGDCMGLINGKRWKQTRVQFDPYFTHRAVSMVSPQLELAVTKYLQQLEAKDAEYIELHATNTARFPFMTTAEYIFGPLTEIEKEELWSLGQRSLALMGNVLLGGLYRFKLYRWLRPRTYRQFKQFESDWTTFNERIINSRSFCYPLPPIMIQTMSEILFANLDVSTHVLGWLVVFLAKDVGVQHQIRKEIANSSENFVEFCGRKDTLLHFSFLESARLRPFTIFTIPESSPQTKVLGGYTIPPNTSVVVDTLSINHNIEFWGNDSLDFKPYRLQHLSPTEVRKNTPK